ncbi:hypothetical protein F4823DRAFT_405367 [Ustulina deusta]|nr:hypothetical protein F4823DRAFT_405367 [Ustulina deusta]
MAILLLFTALTSSGRHRQVYLSGSHRANVIYSNISLPAHHIDSLPPLTSFNINGATCLCISRSYESTLTHSPLRFLTRFFFFFFLTPSFTAPRHTHPPHFSRNMSWLSLRSSHNIENSVSFRWLIFRVDMPSLGISPFSHAKPPLAWLSSGSATDCVSGGGFSASSPGVSVVSLIHEGSHVVEKKRTIN